MILAIEWARALSLVLWMLVAALSAPSAWRSLGHGTSSNDGWRGLVFFVALVMILFIGRWFIARSNEDAYLPLQVFSALCALYAIRVVRSYGRGR
jgi:hypothetical protein